MGRPGVGDSQEGFADLKSGREGALARLAHSPVARLATIGANGKPHIVPITFVISGDTVFSMVDSKPKTTNRLKRLGNIDSEPRVSVLADHYEDDWSRLWWTRLDGLARVETDGPDWDTARRLLPDKYRQYRNNVPDGPVIVITVASVTWWQGLP